MKIKKLFFMASALILSLSSLTAIAPSVFAAGTTFTWTAGGGAPTSMNDQGNWDTGDNTPGDDGVPGSDDVVIIANAGGGTVVHDIPGNPHFRSFTVNPDFFQFSGNTLYTGWLASNSSSASTFNMPVSLVTDVTVTSNFISGTMILAQQVDFPSAVRYDILGNPAFNNGFTSSATSIHFNDPGAGGSNAIVGVSGDSSTSNSPIYVDGGYVNAHTPTSLGSGSHTVTLNDGVLDLSASTYDNATYPGTFVFNGGELWAESTTWDDLDSLTHGVVTLSGSVNMAGDINYRGIHTDIKITGPLSGSAIINIPDGEDGDVFIQSSNNSSVNMPNRTYTPAVKTTTYPDSTSAALNVNENNIAIVDGARGTTNVYSGGILKGIGTVGTLSVYKDGHLAPGHSPGCLIAGDTTIIGSFDVEIGGKTACTDYDQLVVNGTVDVTDGDLNVSHYNSFEPKVGNEFIIVRNDGSDSVTGTFSGLDEGGTFKVGKYTYEITYEGGIGNNDIVITLVDIAEKAPGSPNTGARGIKANPMLTGVATLVSSGSMALIVRRRRLFS